MSRENADLWEYTLFEVKCIVVPCQPWRRPAVSAVRFLLIHVVKRPYILAEVPRPKPEKSLPVVLSREAIMRLLGAVKNRKHRTLLLLVYSAGLRVSEVVRLMPEDLEAERGLIRIRKAKG